MKKIQRIALAAAALALPFTLAAPAQAAPAPAAVPAYCITMAGALTCIGTLPPSNYVQAPVKRIPERTAQRVYVRQLSIQLIQQRIAARQALLRSR